MSRSRWRFFLVEALRSLRGNVATTLAATVTVLIVMFLAGVGIALGSYIYSYTEKVKRDLTVTVFLKDDATRAQRLAIQKRLLADPRVDSTTVNYITSDDAYARMKKRLGENNPLFRVVLPGTFPASWEAKARDADDLPAIAAGLRNVSGLEPPKQGLDNPRYGGQTTDRVLRVAGAIEAVIVLMSAVLIVAAILLIGNTIRLSIFARRREVEVMKLVGATNWFVRWPFMLEGVICGLAGSALAVVLLLFSGQALRDAVGSSVFDGQSDVSSIGLPALAGILLLAGLGLGAAGSGLTMRRFLRV